MYFRNINSRLYTDVLWIDLNVYETINKINTLKLELFKMIEI